LEGRDPQQGSRLLDLDQELARAIPARDLAQARRNLVVPTFELAEGCCWWPTVDEEGQSATMSTVLLVSGLVSRDIHLGGRTASELHGPGDVLCSELPDERLFRDAVKWNIQAPTVLAHLDRRFDEASVRWPRLMGVVAARLRARAERVAAHMAVLHMSRVEERIMAVMRLTADRWGKPSEDGVLVPIPLTHQMVGQLVAAQRPSVTLALRDLAHARRLVKVPGEGWLLLEPTDGSAEMN
jgi:CRP/FNR family cyclic AMP-dependent transcriptional regulator